MSRILTRDDGRRFHLGGRIPPAEPLKLRMHDPKYGLHLANWPETPSSTSYGAIASAQPVLHDLLGNDELGDCTEANSYHLQALRQAAAGRPVFHPTLEQVIATYSRDGGYVPGDASTDQGCDEVTVLKNAMRRGISSNAGVDKISGFISIDATNRELVRKCISAFVGASVCMGLPEEWITPFPSAPGWTWDVPKGRFLISNGHCFTVGDQDEGALACWSWGMPFTLTYDALAAGAVESNGGAIYIVIDADILNTASQAAPDGLDWACLKADFAAIT